MIVVEENFEGKGLVHTYSNEGKKLLQVDTGDIYDEAIDLPGMHTYEEYEEPEPEEEEENTDEQEENIVEDEATN